MLVQVLYCTVLNKYNSFYALSPLNLIFINIIKCMFIWKDAYTCNYFENVQKAAY